MDKNKKKSVSSGIPQLDTLLGTLYIGDNVLWYEDAGSFSAAFCANFIRESLAGKKPMIYVSFDRSPKNVVTFLGSLAENQNFTILDCFTNGKGDRSEVFNKFYEKDGAQWSYQVVKVNDPTNPGLVGDAIYGLHASMSGDIRFIIDSLTGMQDLWGGEEQVLKFYARTCPRLYELDTIAYWIIEKSAHSSRLKANINKIAQVAIELAVRNGKPVLKILKAEKRNSKVLNEPQPFTCEDSEIVFEQQRTLPLRFDLGARIRTVRKQQGLSQKELAVKTGVSPSSISQVEKNLICPSLPALYRMAESLAVDMGSFFTEAGEREERWICRSGEGISVSFDNVPKGVISGERLLPAGMINAEVEPYLINFPAGGKLPCHFFKHKGAELGYVLAGSLVVQVAGHIRELMTNDVLYLQSDIPEQWDNPGEVAAELLWLKIR